MNNNNTISLHAVYRHFKRLWLFCFIFTLLLAGLAFMASLTRPKVFESRAKLLVSEDTNARGAALYGNAVPPALPLPEGALQAAMESRSFVEVVIKRLEESKMPTGTYRPVVEGLRSEVATGKFKTLRLSAQLDLHGNGTYTVLGKAGTPELARQLTAITSEELVAWDKNRSASKLREGQEGFSRQLQLLESKLQASESDTERTALREQQLALQQGYNRLSVLEHSTAGVLNPLSEATLPIKQINPRPVLAALLFGMLGTVFSAMLILLRAMNDKTIRSEDDLGAMGLKVLASFTRVKSRLLDVRGFLGMQTGTGLAESASFLRNSFENVLANKGIEIGATYPVVTRGLPIGEPQHRKIAPVLMVTSSAPGEGKSSITAVLADSFARDGKSVLLIDADLRRGSQQDIWMKRQGGVLPPVAVVGHGKDASVTAALQHPDHLQGERAAENVVLLPAIERVRNTSTYINHAVLARALDIWRHHFDVILIDSAPVLALSDALVIGKHADAVAVVVESERTDQDELLASLRRLGSAGVVPDGVVLNKQDARANDSYNYDYSPQGGFR